MCDAMNTQDAITTGCAESLSLFPFLQKAFPLSSDRADDFLDVGPESAQKSILSPGCPNKVDYDHVLRDMQGRDGSEQLPQHMHCAWKPHALYPQLARSRAGTQTRSGRRWTGLSAGQGGGPPACKIHMEWFQNPTASKRCAPSFLHPAARPEQI